MRSFTRFSASSLDNERRLGRPHDAELYRLAELLGVADPEAPDNTPSPSEMANEYGCNPNQRTANRGPPYSA